MRLLFNFFDFLLNKLQKNLRLLFISLGGDSKRQRYGAASLLKYCPGRNTDMSTEQPQIWSTVPNRIFENLIIQVKGRMNYLNLNLITVQYVFLFLEKLLLNIQPPIVQYMREISKKRSSSIFTPSTSFFFIKNKFKQ